MSYASLIVILVSCQFSLRKNSCELTLFKMNECTFWAKRYTWFSIQYNLYAKLGRSRFQNDPKLLSWFYMNGLLIFISLNLRKYSVRMVIIVFKHEIEHVLTEVINLMTIVALCYRINLEQWLISNMMQDCYPCFYVLSCPWFLRFHVNNVPIAWGLVDYGISNALIFFF